MAVPTDETTHSAYGGGASGGPAAFAHVLEHDPELVSGLADEAERELATRNAVAPAFSHARGPWRFFPDPEPGSLGALLFDGLVLLRIECEGRAHAELLVAGDVISPWTVVGGEPAVASTMSAIVVTPARIALLDRRFAVATARWPEIHGALVHRLIVRARRLSIQAAINSLPRVDDRLEMTLWHLSDQLGQVTPDGVAVRLPLTHRQLAEIVAAQRPSVTSGLRHLVAEGRSARLDDGRWLLLGERPRRLAPLERQSGLEP